MTRRLVVLLVAAGACLAAGAEEEEAVAERRMENRGSHWPSSTSMWADVPSDMGKTERWNTWGAGSPAVRGVQESIDAFSQFGGQEEEEEDEASDRLISSVYDGRNSFGGGYPPAPSPAAPVYHPVYRQPSNNGFRPSPTFSSPPSYAIPSGNSGGFNPSPPSYAIPSSHNNGFNPSPPSYTGGQGIAPPRGISNAFPTNFEQFKQRVAQNTQPSSPYQEEDRDYGSPEDVHVTRQYNNVRNFGSQPYLAEEEEEEEERPSPYSNRGRFAPRYPQYQPEEEEEEEEESYPHPSAYPGHVRPQREVDGQLKPLYVSVTRTPTGTSSSYFSSAKATRKQPSVTAGYVHGEHASYNPPPPPSSLDSGEGFDRLNRYADDAIDSSFEKFNEEYNHHNRDVDTDERYESSRGGDDKFKYTKVNYRDPIIKLYSSDDHDQTRQPEEEKREYGHNFGAIQSYQGEYNSDDDPNFVPPRHVYDDEKPERRYQEIEAGGYRGRYRDAKDPDDDDEGYYRPQEPKEEDHNEEDEDEGPSRYHGRRPEYRRVNDDDDNRRTERGYGWKKQ